MSNPALPTWLTDSLRQSTKATQEPSSPSFPRTALSLGHDAILGWSDQEFIGAHGHVTVKKVAQKKNVATVKADWKSTYYGGPSSFEFVLDGERIQELRIKGE